MFNQKFFFTLLVSLLLTVGLTLSCNSSDFKTSDKLGLTDDGKNGADGTGKNGDDGENGNDGEGINIDDITRDDGEDGSNVCKWFDDDNPNYKAQVPGFPAGVLFPIKEFKDLGVYDGDNFAVNLTLYKVTRAPYGGMAVGEYSFEEPGLKYDIEFTPYSVLIADYKKPSCVATAAKTGATKVRHTGCFDPASKILMADKSEKALLFVRQGDKIFNPVLNRAFTVQDIIEGPEADKPMYRVGYNGQSVKVTQDHAFITEKGVKATRDLKVGDKLQGADGKFHAISMHKQLPVNKYQVVINLTLVEASPDNILEHAIVADGILTGDLYLQEKLTKAVPVVASK